MTAPTELDDIAVIKAVGALIGLNPDASATTKAETAIRAYLSALPASGAGWREQVCIDITEALLDAEKALKQIVDAMMPGQARRLAREALVVIGPAVASVLPSAPDRRLA